MPTSPDRGDWSLGKTVESDALAIATAQAARTIGQVGRLARIAGWHMLTFNLQPSTFNPQPRFESPLLALNRRALTGRAESSRCF
jgi:16S rRNA A1518/A1519 N6-dimethyltransferase RsmA/KsgA/DIM1 with predicted DNA glycosylase/AP lyase activity